MQNYKCKDYKNPRIMRVFSLLSIFLNNML
jgi:hypothetical protein